jgi:RNA polymerase sigma factor (sigma-70 family)
MRGADGPAGVVGGDVGELYGVLASKLEQIVRLDVRAPDVVIEDACQFAWSRLIHHRHRVHTDTVMPWLARTAVREAFKVLRRGQREVSLEAELDQAGEPACPPARATPQELVEQHERLAEIGQLPERQQRFLWLYAMGLSYAEIALHEGCTIRTVERQLLRAKHNVGRQDAAQR